MCLNMCRWADQKKIVCVWCGVIFVHKKVCDFCTQNRIPSQISVRCAQQPIGDVLRETAVTATSQSMRERPWFIRQNWNARPRASTKMVFLWSRIASALCPQQRKSRQRKCALCKCSKENILRFLFATKLLTCDCMVQISTIGNLRLATEKKSSNSCRPRSPINTVNSPQLKVLCIVSLSDSAMPMRCQVQIRSETCGEKTSQKINAKILASLSWWTSWWVNKNQLHEKCSADWRGMICKFRSRQFTELPKTLLSAGQNLGTQMFWRRHKS